MAIEIRPTPRIKVKKVHWLKIVLYLLLTVFLVFLLSYFLLIFYKSKLTEELSAAETKLTRTAEERALEERIIVARRRIQDWSQLASKHPLPLRVFELLEKNTHPQVWFTGFKLDLEHEIMTLEGEAATFEVLGQQLLILEQQELIKGIALSEVSVGKEREIAFNLLLTLDPKILK
jgi:hypothetical protein